MGEVFFIKKVTQRVFGDCHEEMQKKLSWNERTVLEYLLWATNYSITKIAKILGYSRTTINNEIKNNSTFWGYFALDAIEKTITREKWKNHFKFLNNLNKYKEFSSLFKKEYDGKLWTVKLTIEKIKNLYPNIDVPSFKTVYNWIKSGYWILNWKGLLRKVYKKGGKREKQSAARRLVGARYVRPFWSRPANINERKEFGHWEIDLIIGKSKGTHCHLLSFTERVSRYGFLVKIPNKNPWNLNLYLWNLIWKHKLNVKSITQDNGLEFSTLFFIGYKLKIFIYKADPYASFQRGSNENFNGLVRRFFKKKTNFDDITEEEILKVQNEINNRPREIFGYLSALEMYEKLNAENPWNSTGIDKLLYGKQKRNWESNKNRNLFFKKIGKLK